MPKITVSVGNEIYQRARVVAAERGSSVSALVRAFLEQLVSPESEFKRLEREEEEIRSQIVNFSASDRLSREAVHGRSR